MPIAKDKKSGRKLRGSIRKNGSRVERSVQKEDGEEWAVEIPDTDKLSPEMRKAFGKMTPKKVALFCAWIINGQNISAAARQIGYNESYARRIFNEYPPFLEAKKYVGNILQMEDAEWIECLPQARQTLRSLLMAKDEKVRYLAAKDIVDRAEGKPVAKMDMTIRDERPSMSDSHMQLIISIMQQTGTGFAEAQAWVRQNPEEADRWIAANVSNAALPPGKEVGRPGKEVIPDAEVVEDVQSFDLSDTETPEVTPVAVPPSQQAEQPRRRLLAFVD